MNLAELNKTVQNINDQFSKELESMKRFPTKIPDITNYIESMSCRSNQYINEKQTN